MWPCCSRCSGCPAWDSSGPAASTITMCRSRSRCSWSPRPSGRIGCVSRPPWPGRSPALPWRSAWRACRCWRCAVRRSALRYVFDPAAAAPLRAYGLSLAAEHAGGVPGQRRPRSLEIELLRAACDQFDRRRHRRRPRGGAGELGPGGAPAVDAMRHAGRGRRGCGRARACGSSRAASAGRSPSWIRPCGRCGSMNISEMQSLGSMLQLEPLSGVATAAFPALGVVAAMLVARAAAP